MGSCQQKGFAFKALQGDFLCQQDIAASEIARRCEAPNCLALSLFVDFINVHARSVTDHIASTAIAADHIKPFAFCEGGQLAAVQM